jgi:regulatory protein
MGVLRKSAVTPAERLEKLRRFCAYQERCTTEVIQRACQLGATKAAAYELAETLAAENYFNDQRYCRSFVRGKFRNLQWGKIKIRHQLLQRGLAPEMVDQAISEEISENEYLMLLHSLMKQRMQSPDEPTTEKCIRFLLQRGFEYDLICTVLKPN